MDKNKNKKKFEKNIECDNWCFTTDTVLHQNPDDQKNSLVFDVNKKYTIEFVTNILLEDQEFEFKSVCKKSGLDFKNVLTTLSNFVNGNSVNFDGKRNYRIDSDEKIVYLKISEDSKN